MPRVLPWSLRLCCLYVCAMLLLASSCTLSGGSKGVEDNGLGIEIGIKNAMNESIDGAYARIDGHTFEFGTVPSGCKKVHVCSGQPVPRQAEVGYQLVDGRMVVEVVAVTPKDTHVSDSDIALYFVVGEGRLVTVELKRFVHVNGVWALKPLDNR